MSPSTHSLHQHSSPSWGTRTPYTKLSNLATGTPQPPFAQKQPHLKSLWVFRRNSTRLALPVTPVSTYFSLPSHSNTGHCSQGPQPPGGQVCPFGPHLALLSWSGMQHQFSAASRLWFQAGPHVTFVHPGSSMMKIKAISSLLLSFICKSPLA